MLWEQIKTKSNKPENPEKSWGVYKNVNKNEATANQNPATRDP